MLLKSGQMWGKMGRWQEELAQLFVGYRQKLHFVIGDSISYREKVDQDGLYVTRYRFNSSLLTYSTGSGTV